MNIYGNETKLSLIKELQNATNQSLIKCKMALERSNYNIDIARIMMARDFDTHSSKLLFISQPYTGRTEEDILEERLKIKYKVEKHMCEIYTVIDQYHQTVPEGANRFHCLSNDLLLMGDAHLIAFSPNWKSSRGCRIEHELAVLYNLPMIEVEF